MRKSYRAEILYRLTLSNPIQLCRFILHVSRVALKISNQVGQMSPCDRPDWTSLSHPRDKLSTWWKKWSVQSVLHSSAVFTKPSILSYRFTCLCPCHAESHAMFSVWWTHLSDLYSISKVCTLHASSESRMRILPPGAAFFCAAEVDRHSALSVEYMI